MRKGMALGLAGLVAASVAAGVALLGGRVDSAAASGPSAPAVVTEHRTITVYKTQTLPQQTIVMAAPSADDDASPGVSASEQPDMTESAVVVPVGADEAHPSILAPPVTRRGGSPGGRSHGCRPRRRPARPAPPRRRTASRQGGTVRGAPLRRPRLTTVWAARPTRCQWRAITC